MKKFLRDVQAREPQFQLLFDGQNTRSVSNEFEKCGNVRTFSYNSEEKIKNMAFCTYLKKINW